MTKELSAAKNSKQIDELDEDIIVVGPGQILSEARKKLSLTQQQVADKLNFRINLVIDIENDNFDHSLPATFNRGYLRNYAKLVAVDIEEVLAAYDLLGIAEAQRSEMQSFSNLTEKQAEHSRLMWLSYLIAAILFGLMVLWWFQKPADENAITTVAAVDSSKASEVQTSDNEVANTTSLENNSSETLQEELQAKLKSQIEQEPQEELLSSEQKVVSVTQTVDDATSVASEKLNNEVSLAQDSVQLNIQQEQSEQLANSTAVFTFSGDCWVNIYDATGERIAWGVKKSGYVMTVSGKAPLKVTLGKPELAEIIFNGQSIDMSPFNVGNIAKFTLPLSSQ
jgi:cytoskeleton protein RodZ